MSTFNLKDDEMEDEHSSAARDFTRNFEDISLQFLDQSLALYQNQDKDQQYDGWWYYLQEVMTSSLVVDEADLRTEYIPAVFRGDVGGNL